MVRGLKWLSNVIDDVSYEVSITIWGLALYIEDKERKVLKKVSEVLFNTSMALYQRGESR